MIINTLAFHLVHFNEQIAKSICIALRKEPDLGHSTAVGDQFHRHILESLAARVHHGFLKLLETLWCLTKGWHSYGYSMCFGHTVAHRIPLTWCHGV